MDALVEKALEKVKLSVTFIDHFKYPVPKKHQIARAINAVDALKSALKTL